MKNGDLHMLEKNYGLFIDDLLILACPSREQTEKELIKRKYANGLANGVVDDCNYNIREIDVVKSDIKAKVLYTIFKNHSPYLSFKEKDKAIDEIIKLQEKMLNDGTKLLTQLKSVDCSDVLSINSYPTPADKLLLESHDLPRYSVRLVSYRA